MAESNQEGYRSLGWIVNESEQGIYLVVADEEMQEEIARIYGQGMVEVYDYRQHPGSYSFQDLQGWVAKFPETQVFFVVNFHLAIQEEEGLRRLNFSRDMIDRLGKNFIFLITPYGDERLATGAYDFYSFVKIRIAFQGYGTEAEGEQGQEELPLVEGEAEIIGGEKPRNKREEMYQANALMRQAWDVKEQAKYATSERLLLQAREIKEKLLGEGHLALAQIDHDLAFVYEKQGRYQEAETLYQKSLRISEKVLGEEHPDTAISYNNLAGVYESEGRYREAEALYQKSLKIREKVLGEEHPDTATSYNNLAGVYESETRYQEAEVLFQKSLKIIEKVLGEEHPDMAISYNNLALVYMRQGKYQEAEALYQKSLKISKKVLGEEHPNTATSYNNLAGVYERQGKSREAEALYQKSIKIIEKILGEEHPDTAASYSNLAGVYIDQGHN